MSTQHPQQHQQPPLHVAEAPLDETVLAVPVADAVAVASADPSAAAPSKQHGNIHASAKPPALPLGSAVDMNHIFDFWPVPSVVLSPACRITQASARFLEAWHTTVQDCVGVDLVSLLTTKSGEGSANVIVAAIDQAIVSRAERTSTAIIVGATSSWAARIIPVFKGDELLSVVLEWQETPYDPSLTVVGEQTKIALSTNEAFRILVQAVKDYAIFLLDTKGNVATWNTGAEVNKGYTRDEIVGKHFSIFYGKEDLEIRKPEMELEICLREGRVEDEGWRYRKDGTRFWANVIITAIYKDGVHVGFGKVTRDLTERKAAESRLIAAYEESEKLKSDFLANMSHEIRTPMHGMLSACTLLLDTPLTEKQRDIANIMDESGQVLLQVINDILDYSKLASGSFSINSDIVGVASIIASVVRSVQPFLQPDVHLELFLASDLPKSAQGDPLRFRQIVQNIVGNAAKFTEKGTIRVHATLLDETAESYTIKTEVSDTGIGIPATAAKGLFTPFTQFDTTTTKRYKGTGLGLSIAKSLTELMGGQVGYCPNPERHGSIFWFTVTFKKIKSLDQFHGWKRQVGYRLSASSSPDIADPQVRLAEAAPTTSLLIVEDNVINQKVMLGMLRSVGFKQIEVASNGAEAVSMVRAKPAAYDLVLMDINMPIVDGYEATAQIRECGIRVPIIAMTAYALKGDRERCLESGMDDYVPKPIDRKHLLRTLVKWLLDTRDYRNPNGDDLLARSTQEPGLQSPTSSADREPAGTRRSATSN